MWCESGWVRLEFLPPHDPSAICLGQYLGPLAWAERLERLPYAPRLSWFYFVLRMATRTGFGIGKQLIGHGKHNMTNCQYR